MENITTKIFEPDKLILVDYENSYEIFTPDQLVKNPESIFNPASIKGFELGRIVSVKEVRPLRDQKHELDTLRIELDESVKIADVMISNLFKLDNKSSEYTESIMRITNYLHDNFVKKVSCITDLIARLYEVNDVNKNSLKDNS